jgi:hypothetical protein
MPEDTPLVHRTVRLGGLLLLAAGAQFLVVLAIAQGRTPGYNLFTSPVVNLLGTASVWSVALDASLITLGVLSIAGLSWVQTSLDEDPKRLIGLSLLFGASAAAVAAGGLFLYPSTVPSWIRTALTAGAAGAAGAGLVVLSYAMLRTDRWHASRWYTLLTGAVVVGSTALAVSGVRFLGIGTASWELVVVAAAILWPAVEGIHMALLHRFAPGLLVKVASA